MKAHILIFFFCICNLSSRSQGINFVDLKKKISAANNPVEKVNALNYLSHEIRLNNADTAILLANQAMDLALQNNYLHGYGTANLCIALANSTKANYETQKAYTQKALEIAGQIKDDSLKAYGLMSLSGYHYNTSNYDKAIEQALQALTLFEQLKQPIGVVKTNVLMSQVYQLKNDLPRAEKILLENLKLLPSLKDIKTKCNLLHTLANVYGMQEKYKEALALDEQGLELCNVGGFTFLKSQFLDNMANCYMYGRKFDLAKKYFLESLLIDSSFENKKQMSDTYLNLGNLSMMQKKHDEAAVYFLHSIQLSNVSGYKQGKYQALLLLGDTYAQVNNHQEAITTLKKAYKVKDSIINESSESKIIELETLYETGKKEQLLKVQQLQIGKKNYLLWGLSAISLLVMLAGITFYKKRQAQNKLALQTEVMNQQNMATQAILEAEEKERQRIARDLHDGVGQVMSAAKMNLSAFENELVFKDEQQKQSFEKVISLIDEGCKEVREVSHQMMPNALLKSGLASALKEFIGKINARLLKIDLYTEGLDKPIDHNIEMVLYRVIQECVNNVIKHSGANELHIALIKDNDGISATVEDNGKGFNLTHQSSMEGIGLKNIRSRIEFLKGQVDFDSSPGKGTLVAIHIPIV